MPGPIARTTRTFRHLVDLVVSLQHITTPVMVLVPITIAGAVGYMVLLDLSFLDGLYQAVITLSTVGFEEIKPFDWKAKLFTIGLILFGVGTVFYGITMVAATVIEGEVRDSFKRRIMMREIESMHDHLILCGYGRVGAEMASMFKARGRNYVIVDQSDDAIGRAEAAGVRYVKGNAEEEEVLKAAGVENAACLVAGTTSDASNTYITLTARALNPRLYIVARSEGFGADDKLALAGANRVISPNAIGARRMALSALQPMMADFMDALTTGRHGDLLVVELEVEKDASFDGITIADAFRDAPSTTVLGIRREDTTLVVGPRGGVTITGGDVVILMATEADIAHLAEQSRSG